MGSRGSRCIRRALFILPLLAICVVMTWASAAQAYTGPYPRFSNERDYQVWQNGVTSYSRNQAIVPSWLDDDPADFSEHQWRARIMDELWRFRHYGWNEDDVNYGVIGKITVGADDARSMSYRPNTSDPNSTAYSFYNDMLKYYFDPGTQLTALKPSSQTDDSAIMLACGNIVTPNPPEPPPPPQPSIPSISGYKYEDYDGNGTWDRDEPTLAGWTIYLSTGGQVVRQTTTGSDGKYVFSMAGLDPGTYSVSEECTAPWQKRETPGPIVIPEGPGVEHGGNNFGNYYPGIIRGAKWDDANVDGQWQKGVERPLVGWTIVLVKNGTVIASTSTAADGSYEFSGLEYGTYDVWETLGSAAAWRQSFPAAVPTLIPPFSTVATGRHSGLAIQSHTVIEDKDFGNVELGSVLKKVVHYWWREPLSGIWVTLSEVNVPGVLANEPRLPRAVKTGSEGEARFDRLLPGRYLIRVALPAGWFPEPGNGGREEVDVPEGGQAERTNGIYNGCGSEPRTMGFWKNWRHRYSVEEMEALITRVQAASGNFEGLTLEALDEILKVSGNKSQEPQIMAEAQYLVLWLNLASERLGFTTSVDISQVPNWRLVVDDADGKLTLHELMLKLRSAYNSGTLTNLQWEALKDICDYINNAWVPLTVPGVTPLTATLAPTSSVKNIGEGVAITLSFEDQFGNPVPGVMVEWSMQGVGQFLADGEDSYSDPTDPGGNRDLDVSDALGMTRIVVKSLRPGEQFVHAKYREKGSCGTSASFRELSSHIQWFDADVGTFDDPGTEANESLKWALVGETVRFELSVLGLKLGFDPSLAEPARQTAIIDVNQDGVFDAADATAVGGTLLIGPSEQAGWPVDSNGNGVIDPAEAGSAVLVVAGNPILVSGVGGCTSFDWDRDGLKEQFADRSGLYVPLEGKTVTPSLVPSLSGAQFTEQPAFTSVGSILTGPVVTGEDGKALIETTSSVKGPQTVAVVVDWPENPRGKLELLRAYGKAGWSVSPPAIP